MLAAACQHSCTPLTHHLLLLMLGTGRLLMQQMLPGRAPPAAAQQEMGCHGVKPGLQAGASLGRQRCHACAVEMCPVLAMCALATPETLPPEGGCPCRSGDVSVHALLHPHSALSPSPVPCCTCRADWTAPFHDAPLSESVHSDQTCGCLWLPGDVLQVAAYFHALCC